MMRAQKKQPIVDRFSATYLPVSLVLWYHCQLKFLSLPVNGRIRETVISLASICADFPRIIRGPVDVNITAGG
jgi:hypothetical protein